MDIAGLRLTVWRIVASWERWDVEDAGRAPWGYLVGVGPHGVLIPRPMLLHPRVSLTRWVAPATWSAAAVAVRGTARRHDCRLGQSDAAARVVWLGDRHGHSASVVIPAGTRPSLENITVHAAPDPGDQRWNEEQTPPRLDELLCRGLRGRGIDE